MKSTYFSNKKSLQIVSSTIRNDIKNQIKNIGSYNLSSKYYTFLNRKNVNNLKETNFSVSLSTFGKKYVLFITKYNSKKYCIFINKKNESMIVTQLKFSDELFNGTLFDGELVKNSDDKWIYLINDIAYYKGDNVVTKSFNEREKIIEKIIQYEQDNNMEENLFISKKNYFGYNNMKDLCETYQNYLNYKCAGLYFKNNNNFSDNYLFIFPECRSDSKILNNIDNKNIEDNENNEDNKDNRGNNGNKGNKDDEEDNDEDNLFKNVEMIKQDNKIELEKRLEKTTCSFLIHMTSLPDIYELYCKNVNNTIERNSYASIPNIETSIFLKNIFGLNYNKDSDIHTIVEKGKGIYVECNYNKVFKKWVPFRKVDYFDSINTINQIQIILDSL